MTSQFGICSKVLDGSPRDYLKMVGFETWAGPVSGVVQCQRCLRECYFDLVDWEELDDDDVRIFFQNHILFLSELKNRFDPDDPFRFVPERAEVNPDGERISEWPLPIAELESFLSREWPLRNGRFD